MRGVKKALEGRTIVKVEINSFPDGRGGTAHDPVLTLDDGTRVWFVTEETDVGEYGTSIGVSKPKVKPNHASKIVADNSHDDAWTG